MEQTYAAFCAEDFEFDFQVGPQSLFRFLLFSL